jgi:hypothetical protein
MVTVRLSDRNMEEMAGLAIRQSLITEPVTRILELLLYSKHTSNAHTHTNASTCIRHTQHSSSRSCLVSASTASPDPSPADAHACSVQ